MGDFWAIIQSNWQIFHQFDSKRLVCTVNETISHSKQIVVFLRIGGKTKFEFKLSASIMFYAIWQWINEWSFPCPTEYNDGREAEKHSPVISNQKILWKIIVYSVYGGNLYSVII